MAGEILQGFQVGFNSALRLQELRSEQAARAARERAVAQEMSIIMEKQNTLIQYRADMAKAFGATKMQTSETVPVFGPNGVIGTVPNPKPMSPEDATFQNIIPIIAKYEPEKVPQALQALATARYRRESSDALTKQRESSTAVNEARTKEIEARTAELQKGNKGANPEFIKTIIALEERGVKYTPEEIRKMHDIKQGLLPRAGTVTIPSEATFIDEHIDKVMEQPSIEEEVITKNILGWKSEPTIKRRRPKSREEGKAYLRKEYQDLYGRGAEAAAPAPPEVSVGEIRKGYRYNGQFPPSDKRGWDKVQ